MSNATLCEMFTSRSATGIDAVPPSIVDALDPLSDALASCVLASFRRDGRPLATGVLGRALLVVDDAGSVVRDKLLDEGLEFLAPEPHGSPDVNGAQAATPHQLIQRRTADTQQCGRFKGRQ